MKSTRSYSTLLFFLVILACGCVLSPSIYAEPSERTPASDAQSSDSFLLDQHPGAYSAYSLRRLRSKYDGPVIRVRRMSDGMERDVGSDGEGEINVSELENWLGGADGVVVTWYSQLKGTPDLTSEADSAPQIARGGTVHVDEDGRPRIKCSTGSGLDAKGISIPIQDVTGFWVGQIEKKNNYDPMFQIGEHAMQLYARAQDGVWFNTATKKGNTGDNFRTKLPVIGKKRSVITRSGTDWMGIYLNDENLMRTTDVEAEHNTKQTLAVGTFHGYVSELVFYPSLTEEEIWDRYDNLNAYWKVGPEETHREALLPQHSAYQVKLYDWLETVSVDDVGLPDGTLTYDNSYDSEDELADIWLQVKGLSASSVTRAEPKWYVLDDGKGHGIEGTGKIRANHDPQGPGGYGGNPARSWQNEPAYWYQLNLPLSDGGEGNPWYRDPAMGKRAMVVSIVDLMMHEGLNEVGSFNWFDMKGKAFLGMAEAYRWAGEVLPNDVRKAYETGMEKIVDQLTERGPRAVNTNMDMFALHGAADLYMATDDAKLKEQCVQLVKRSLFGSVDGELETNHEVFKSAKGYDGGVFDPSGFIMEGDQPDVFYGGESIFHLAGALEAVTDRDTATVPKAWTFLKEVVRRLQEWRTYQMFYDPYRNSPHVAGFSDQILITAGAGFSGRTGAGVPAGQANKPWKSLSIAYRWKDNAFKASGLIKSPQKMESGISNKLSSMNKKMSSYYTEKKPKEWKGWSPWTKKTTFLPPRGWYSDLKALDRANDEHFEKIPAEREKTLWNRTFGGDPVGEEYWSYKQKDANGKAFGFFVEAQSRQGGYGGWYGGKIETFWTEKTGVLLLNRHGKTGCDDHVEDSVCWDNLNIKAGHHVWGRDENGKGFTTLLIRGCQLDRTAAFETDTNPPSVTVNNLFNDPNGMAGQGEETGAELQGSVEVKNQFEAQPNGLKVIHTVTSDETDEITELWASIPVYLRHYNPEGPGDKYHAAIEDTLIEYWNGNAWKEVPSDMDDDSIPEMIRTEALRLSRDYGNNTGVRRAYVSFPSPQKLRRAESKYYDPYQTMTGVQTIHFDLHGDPGTVQSMPDDKQLSYTIQTTDPTKEE